VEDCVDGNACDGSLITLYCIYELVWYLVRVLKFFKQVLFI
jgi:hypothetical protein